jgi:hypothetical protein
LVIFTRKAEIEARLKTRADREAGLLVWDHYTLTRATTRYSACRADHCIGVGRLGEGDANRNDKGVGSLRGAPAIVHHYNLNLSADLIPLGSHGSALHGKNLDHQTPNPVIVDSISYLEGAETDSVINDLICESKLNLASRVSGGCLLDLDWHYRLG